MSKDTKRVDREQPRLTPLEVDLQIPEGEKFPTGVDLRTSSGGAYREMVVQVGVEDMVVVVCEEYPRRLDVVADLLVDPSWDPGWTSDSHAYVLRARVLTAPHAEDSPGLRLAASGQVHAFLEGGEVSVPFRRLAFQIRGQEQVFGIMELPVDGFAEAYPEVFGDDVRGFLERHARRLDISDQELEGFRSLLVGSRGTEGGAA